MELDALPTAAVLVDDDLGTEAAEPLTRLRGASTGALSASSVHVVIGVQRLGGVDRLRSPPFS